ncbi:MAG: hypothetical protein KUG70_09925 [Rhodobacteraceae bacterium]|nr:hypothetical protein [Paracoccaceae bacterium]
MDTNKPDNPDSFPALGRALLWVDKPGSATKIIYALAAVCVVLGLLDFAYHKHGHFEVEYLPNFYGFYGFIMFTALILLAKTLRLFIKRPEDYYGDKAIDSETYPVDQLDEAQNDA